MPLSTFYQPANSRRYPTPFILISVTSPGATIIEKMEVLQIQNITQLNIIRENFNTLINNSNNFSFNQKVEFFKATLNQIFGDLENIESEEDIYSSPSPRSSQP